MKKGLIAFVLILFTMFFAFGSGSAQAGFIMDFDVNYVPGGPGTISFNGTTLSGTLIPVDNLVTSSGGTYPTLAGAHLDFSAPAAYSGGVWNITSPGSVTLTGGIGAPINIANGTQLITNGILTSATVIPTGSAFKFLISEFTDDKDPALAGFFGQPATGWNGIVNISFMATPDSQHKFTSSTILSGNVVNTVPVPASLLLLGSGLVGLVGLGRKKFLKG